MYFSPTGGTKKVMDILTEECQGTEQIDLSDAGYDFGKLSFGEDDICFIGVPAYGGRVPFIVSERIRKMKADNTAAVLAAVYGNRAIDDTLLELKNEVKKCGFHPIAGVSAVAEHSIMRQYGTGRPDEKDTEELRQFSRKIRETLNARREGQELIVPGNMPYREYNGVPFKPKAGKKCIKCGKCAAVCPVGAIPLNDPASVDPDKCISCMRCIAICPAKVRKVSRITLTAASKKLKNACSGRKENELFL